MPGFLPFIHQSRKRQLPGVDVEHLLRRAEQAFDDLLLRFAFGKKAAERADPECKNQVDLPRVRDVQKAPFDPFF